MISEASTIRHTDPNNATTLPLATKHCNQFRQDRPRARIAGLVQNAPEGKERNREDCEQNKPMPDAKCTHVEDSVSGIDACRFALAIVVNSKRVKSRQLSRRDAADCKRE